MSFEFKKGTRQGVSLFLSIAGPSGSGKTLSALKLARGLAGGHPDMDPRELEKIDQTIAAIDTEAGRILHYAPGRGELPGPNTFAVCHGDLHAPFTGEAYLEAIEAAERAGFKVIVIDSFTHIWLGEGGCHDQHKAFTAQHVERAKKRHERFRRDWEFDEKAAAESVSAAGWDVAKAGYKRVLARIGQLRAHVIVCLRAEEKLQILKEKDERGKERTVYVHTKDLPEAQRWVPLIEFRFHYEPIASLVLSPNTPGVPYPIKLQEQHRQAIRLDRPISEESGLLLRQWAAGDPMGEPQAEPPKPRKLTFAEALVEKIDREGEAGLREARDTCEREGRTKQLEHINRHWAKLLEHGRAVDAAKAAKALPEPALPGI